MSKENLIKSLQEFGLGDKEAKVYMAGLEVGSATAQQLAAKALVERPTAYVAIASLSKRGLMSQFTKGKKQYFRSEKPDRLLHLLEQEEKQVIERGRRLRGSLPTLQTLVADASDKPEARYYEGLDGLEAIRRVLLDSKAKEIRMITSQPDPDGTPEDSLAARSLRLRKNEIAGWQIAYTGQVENKPAHSTEDPAWHRKVVAVKSPEDLGEIAVFKDHVAMIAGGDKPYGFVIKSHEVANTARLMFEALWKSLPGK